MSIEERREYQRRPFIKPIKYHLTVSGKGRLEHIHRDGISVDVSEGGLGMITDFPLSKGNILYFEPEIKVNEFEADSAMVRWALAIENNRYRVGLKFVR